MNNTNAQSRSQIPDARAQKTQNAVPARESGRCSAPPPPPGGRGGGGGRLGPGASPGRPAHIRTIFLGEKMKPNKWGPEI